MQITKRRAKAAFKESHSTVAPFSPPPRTKPGNKKNIQLACEPVVRGVNNTTKTLKEHVATPHTSGKRYKTSDGCIYVDWELPGYCVTTPKADNDIERLMEVDRTRVGAELNANPDGYSDDSNPRNGVTVSVKPSQRSVSHTHPRMSDCQDQVTS